MSSALARLMAELAAYRRGVGGGFKNIGRMVGGEGLEQAPAGLDKSLAYLAGELTPPAAIGIGAPAAMMQLLGGKETPPPYPYGYY